MKFIIVKKEDLSLQGSYEADVKDDTSANRSWLIAEPMCAHIALPEGLDADCIKAELQDEVIVLVADEDKVAAKVIATKQAQVKALLDALNLDVYGQMQVVYTTTNPDSAVAYHETWKLMLSNPADFVTVTGLPDAATVQAYAEGKLAAVKAYAIYRLEKIMAFEAAKAAILA